MKRFTLTISQRHRQRLLDTLRFDGLEDAALLICGRSEQLDPWTGEYEHRFIVNEVVALDARHIIDRTAVSITWDTAAFYNLLKRIESKDFAIASVHTHPAGHLEFSEQDDTEEQDLFAIAFNRNDSRKPHLSVVVTPDGEIAARAYADDLEPQPVAMIRTIGDRWSFRYPGRNTFQTPESLERQARVFASAATHDLSNLRIGIAGAGGTGSAVALLLARVGVTKLALFDRDRVAYTNLNRMHFSRQTDANLGRLKVEVLATAVAELGLGTRVLPYDYAIDEEIVRDAVKSCDLIFGCTDDNLGRIMLNRLAYFYGIPVIDMGLLIERNDADDGYDTFDGRVTVIQSAQTCQICRGLIDAAMARAEGLRRYEPSEYIKQRRAGYVPDEPEPAPVVVTFTTEVASMAVNELFQRLTLFRGPAGSAAERIRRFDEPKPTDILAGCMPRDGCPLCSDQRRYDGRGDMTPFLDLR